MESETSFSTDGRLWYYHGGQSGFSYMMIRSLLENNPTGNFRWGCFFYFNLRVFLYLA